MNGLAQNVVISGLVKSISGETIPGATIFVKGTNKGTTTDADGKFTLSGIPANSKAMIFSFIGMKSQEVVIGNKTKFVITLEEETIGLEEVVAIGYGSMKKADMTGSAGSIQTKDLVKAPVKSFDEALAGRIAGVQVVSNDGQPGSLPQIIIRGGQFFNSGQFTIIRDRWFSHRRE